MYICHVGPCGTDSNALNTKQKWSEKKQSNKTNQQLKQKRQGDRQGRSYLKSEKSGKHIYLSLYIYILYGYVVIVIGCNRVTPNQWIMFSIFQRSWGCLPMLIHTHIQPAPSSVLAPSSDGGAPSSFLFLVARPGAPSSVHSDARSP